jgi:hypothetical protein
VVVFPFLACANQASELYRPVFGGEASHDLVLLAPPVNASTPSLPEVAAFSATLASPAFQLPEGDLMNEASAIPILRDNQPGSPSARFILLILVVMMMIRFFGPFRDVISDICYMLLTIDQDGR